MRRINIDVGIRRFNKFCSIEFFDDDNTSIIALVCFHCVTAMAYVMELHTAHHVVHCIVHTL